MTPYLPKRPSNNSIKGISGDRNQKSPYLHTENLAEAFACVFIVRKIVYIFIVVYCCITDFYIAK